MYLYHHICTYMGTINIVCIYHYHLYFFNGGQYYNCNIYTYTGTHVEWRRYIFWWLILFFVSVVNNSVVNDCPRCTRPTTGMRLQNSRNGTTKKNRIVTTACLVCILLLASSSTASGVVTKMGSCPKIWCKKDPYHSSALCFCQQSSSVFLWVGWWEICRKPLFFNNLL